MALLTGIFTNKGREILAKSLGQIGTGITTYASYFKFGEGGYIETPGGRVPKSPDAGVGYLDIEAASSPTLFEFQKNLIATDFTFIAPSTIQIRCRLVESEANDNGFGDSPRFFELGVFDQNSNLLIYCTFSEQTKSASKILNNLVQVVF